MRATLPTELLMRLINASPEQYAAVAKILGVNTEGGTRSAEFTESEPEPLREEVARAAFAMVVKLDADGSHKAPAPLTVFRLYCVDGMSAERVARKCQCGKATVIRRLQLIEERTGMKAEEFRAMSGHLQRLEDDFKSSGAREIYRRGLANSEEE